MVYLFYYVTLFLGVLFSLSTSFQPIKYNEIAIASGRMLVHPSGRNKRQAMSNIINDNCVLKNVMEMNQNLIQAYPDLKNSDMVNFVKAISEDPDSVEKYCNATLPNYKQMVECPEDYLKTVMLKSLKMTETMCITNYEEYKKHNPCLIKVGKLYDESCRQKCSSNEHAYQSLVKYSKNLMDVFSQSDVRQIFKGSCLYAECLMDCTLPHVRRACQPEAERLAKSSVAETFSSITDLFSTLPQKINVWPEECENIGKKFKN